MRHEKVVAILNLARKLASDAEGVTLDEMAEMVGVSRRTAERMRDAIEQCFSQLERLEDGRKVRFRMSANVMGGMFNAPTSQEMAELENAARGFETTGNSTRAATLRTLSHKIGASLRDPVRRRLSADIDAQLRAEAFGRQVGPKPISDPKILTLLREALLAGLMVKMCYGGESGGKSKWREVVPYGILFAPRYYLIAGVQNKPEPALFRLDRILSVEPMEEPGIPPETFDLKAYADRSFGVFQEEAVDVVLRFSQSAAADAKTYLFHPSQSVELGEDGTLTVRFKAGGLLQMVHHFMTWGNTVTVVSPSELKDLMQEQVAALYAHHVSKQTE